MPAMGAEGVKEMYEPDGDSRLASMIRVAYGPIIKERYGLTFDEFADHVRAHGDLMPPIVGFGDTPGCAPHFFCTHGPVVSGAPDA